MLRNMLLAIALLAGALLTVPSRAMMAQIDDATLVGLADLIVIGTVDSPTVDPNAPDATAGRAVLKIEQVLHGDPTLQTVSLRYPIPPRTQPGMIVSDGGGLMLRQGQRQLFFLQNAAGGYTPVYGGQGLRAPEAAGTFTGYLTPTLTATIVSPVGPFYFGQNIPVKVVIKNTSTQEVMLGNVTPEAFFRAERFGTRAPLTNVIVFKPSNAIQARPRISPGSTFEQNLVLTCAVPTGWQIYGPDSYIQAPIALRALVQTYNAEGTTSLPLVCTPWVQAYVGYPLPSDAAGLPSVTPTK